MSLEMLCCHGDEEMVVKFCNNRPCFSLFFAEKQNLRLWNDRYWLQ